MGAPRPHARASEPLPATPGRWLIRNVVLNVLGQGALLLLAAVGIPILIHGLGTERFGLLALAWVVYGSPSPFELGLGRAVTRAVADALGRGAEEQASVLVWSAAGLQLLFGCLVGALLAGITPSFVDRILELPEPLATEARLSLYLLAGSLPLTLPTGAFRGALEAAQRFGALNAIQVAWGSTKFLVPVVGWHCGWGLLPIVAMMAASSGLALLALYRACLETLPPLRQRPRLSRAALSALARLGGWLALSHAFGPCLLYLDRFVLGSLATLTAVAQYTALFELATRLWIIPQGVAMTLVPAFSSRWMSHPDEVRRLYTRAMKFLLLIMGLMTVTMMPFARHGLRLWLGPTLAPDSPLVLQLLLVGTLISSITPVSAGLLLGLGRPDMTAKLYVMYVPLNAALVWWGVQQFGMVGAALSFAARAAIDASAHLLLSARLTRLSAGYLVRHGVVRGLGPLGAVGALIWCVAEADAFAWRVGLMALAVLSGVVMTWWWVLDDLDRRLLTSVALRWRRPMVARPKSAHVEE